MEKSRLEGKVGLFVFVGLVLAATLLVIFSKGATRFSSAYELRLRTTDVGTIRPGASVLMAGYPIGDVSKLVLATNGQTVVLILKIKKENLIRTNSLFVLEQSGFLGDQYVAIYPGTNSEVPFLESGAEVSCPPPFNIQQTARDASGFIKRTDETVANLNNAISDVRKHVLNEYTLTNLAAAVVNLRIASEKAVHTVEEIGSVVSTNAPAVAAVASNLVYFSKQMSSMADTLDNIILTNGAGISSAVSNVQSSTVTLRNIVEDVQAGKGLAGTVLKDPELAANVAAIASNLSITTSNLNRIGLWGILWSHKPPKAAATNQPPARAVGSPKSASQ